MNKEKNFPWIFYITIEFNTDWFSYWWKTRGANFLQLQILFFKIKLGRPWLKCYLENQIKEYGSLKYVKETNDSFKDSWYAFQIGKYE